MAVVEFGPETGAKAELLLAGLRPRPPMSRSISRRNGWRPPPPRCLGAPGLPVLPVVADFTQPFALAEAVGAAPRLGFFPGSTIGNFEPAEATAFLRRAAASLGAGSRMLLGADLVKEVAVLEAAYDDAAGVTAAFDLNLLHRLNREAGADFDLGGFRPPRHLEPGTGTGGDASGLASAAGGASGGTEFPLRRGRAHPHREQPQIPARGAGRLAKAAGWRAAAMWSDPQRLFSVWLLEG